MSIARLCAAGCLAVLSFLPAARAQTGYPVLVVDQLWRDDNRNRDIPVRLRIPQIRGNTEKLPLIIYSHGLTGTRESGDRWGQAWAANGYFVIHVQHRGSDEDAWRAIESRAKVLRGVTLNAAMGQLVERSMDMRFVLDEAARRPEFAQADLARVGIAGHSFGAYTVQALAGQRVSRRAMPVLAEPRVRAAIAFSPIVRNRVDAENQFEDVHMPFFSITGSLDEEEYGPTLAADERVRPFFAMPPKHKYLLVFQNGDHTALAGSSTGAVSTKPRVPAATDADAHIVRTTQLMTVAFWDAYLKDNPAAERWLLTQSRKWLSPDDRFMRR